MTIEQQAKKLVSRYIRISTEVIGDKKTGVEYAKKCALISINYTLEQLEVYGNFPTTVGNLTILQAEWDKKRLNKIKEEINKL